jgi:hypothetical protein
MDGDLSAIVGRPGVAMVEPAPKADTPSASAARKRKAKVNEPTQAALLL